MLTSHRFSSVCPANIRLTVAFRCFVLVPCVDFASSVNGAQDSIDCDGSGHGDTCELTCEDGYLLSNNQRSGTYTCTVQSSGDPTWSHDDEDNVLPSCSPGALPRWKRVRSRFQYWLSQFETYFRKVTIEAH